MIPAIRIQVMCEECSSESDDCWVPMKEKDHLMVNHDANTQAQRFQCALCKKEVTVVLIIVR